MCGISGIKRFSQKVSLEAIDFPVLNRNLFHRGPDAAGIVNSQSIIMGHQRLAITDETVNADQPMTSNCGRYRIVFNGEVYNYADIKKKIQGQKPDLEFISRSDTEIVLESFALWGPGAVYEWEGMFSVAIWDKQEKCLWLFRDRLGEKPLYYYYDTEYFAFASELKFIEHLPFFIKKVNGQSVNLFLQLGFVPDPLTIYQKVYKLKAGHYLQVQNGEVEVHPYWNLNDMVLPDLIQDEDSALETLDTLLHRSVSSRLSKRLCNGIFLSGGVDSSLISAIASRSSNRLKSFSLGFSGEKNNETVHAEKIAHHLGMEHHSLIAGMKDARSEVEGLEDVFDEPFADSSALAVLLLSKFAKREVRIILSGEGSDELFFGYGHYQWPEYLSNKWIWRSRKVLSQILRFGSHRHQRAADVFAIQHRKDYSYLISCAQEFFNAKEIAVNSKLVPMSHGMQKEHYGRNLTMTEEFALFDINNYLKGDLLVKLDRCTMRHSIESRCPFLDANLVSFALNLSPELKIKNKTQKFLLKKQLCKYFPAGYFDRPKQGFSVPLLQWLKTDFKYLTEEYLSPEIVKRTGIFKPSYTESLKKAFYGGKDYLYKRLWTITLLHKWYVKKMLSVTTMLFFMSSGLDPTDAA